MRDAPPAERPNDSKGTLPSYGTDVVRHPSDVIGRVACLIASCFFLLFGVFFVGSRVYLYEVSDIKGVVCRFRIHGWLPELWYLVVVFSMHYLVSTFLLPLSCEWKPHCRSTGHWDPAATRQEGYLRADLRFRLPSSCSDPECSVREHVKHHCSEKTGLAASMVIMEVLREQQRSIWTW
ncbi:uncharacterized protein IWZ02DRAFT_202729 [Phyllosticta citriasiana]|uniref:uncharacterized protein n=1 Tax=Phyllosticta citriasiana TaxID=595635 RepID=UPI0030FD66DB